VSIIVPPNESLDAQASRSYEDDTVPVSRNGPVMTNRKDKLYSQLLGSHKIYRARNEYEPFQTRNSASIITQLSCQLVQLSLHQAISWVAVGEHGP
jgi:hypothetical protein